MALMLICTCCGRHFEVGVPEWRQAHRDQYAYCAACKERIATGHDPTEER